MESIVVEAIRQIPALILAALALFFYRAAKKAGSVSHDAVAIPEKFKEQISESSAAISRLESEIESLRSTVDAHDELTQQFADTEESIRSQLSNQKMALKEFGRVLSKTSEQTYTEFNSLDDRVGRVEKALTDRGMMDGESRSAAA